MFDVKEQVNRVEREMTERGLAFQHADEMNRPALVLGFGGDEFSIEELVVFVVFDKGGASARLVTQPILHVPMERTAAALFDINEINAKFHWVRFYLDRDNDVIADCDVKFDELSAGWACAEAVERMAAIVDDAYGRLAE